MSVARGELRWNALRYAGRPGHVESYFLRANDPERPRAVWLKATVFAPLSGAPQVETWFIFFDASREQGRQVVGGRETAPFSEALFDSTQGREQVRACRLALDLSPHGSAKGEFATRGGDARVDLAWASSSSPVAAPLSPLRPSALLAGPFPRSKLLTPFPSLHFSGTLDVAGERIRVEEWPGMEGHNWGKEHAFEYAWGQCLFPASGSAPEAMLEGFTARVRVAGRVTPRVSCLIVRRGERTLRFDRLLDLWRQEAVLSTDRWSLRMSGGDGEARLEMDATGRPMACLGYKNPDDHVSYCFNSKLARVRLQVQPHRGAAFACESEHGGALEFLRHQPDPRFPDVI